MTEKTEAKPKQSNIGKHYKIKECPYCHKLTGNVKNHILLKHQTDGPPPAETPPKAKELTKEDLLGGKGKSPDHEEKEDRTFECSRCRARVRYHEAVCHNCGEVLIWDGI